MMVNICNALANGLLQPWLPVQSKDSEKQELSVTDKSEKKDVKGMKVSKFQKSPTVSISIDALPDIKKAIEVYQQNFILFFINTVCSKAFTFS